MKTVTLFKLSAYQITPIIGIDFTPKLQQVNALKFHRCVNIPPRNHTADTLLNTNYSPALIIYRDPLLSMDNKGKLNNH